MCGIAGVVGRPRVPVDPRELGDLVRAMGHRGPDAAGTWERGSTALAHTRLSLVDLSSAGDQPWSEGDDALVFNGELYNFRELRTDLEQKGTSFTSSTDTEVLFALIKLHGLDEALARVRGMFAFAYYDGRSSSTFLCRDRFGIKPLLYAQRPNSIVFASEAKALGTCMELEVDEVYALLSLRTLGDKSLRRTLFKGVHQVQPGEVVELRDGAMVTRRSFAELTDFIDEARYEQLSRATFDDVRDELAALMQASVRSMAAADASLGVFLSGGVDSALITALAARAGREDLRAFTSDVAGPSSEVERARSIANAVGVPISVSRFEPTDWVDDWAKATWHLETPVITNPSAVPFARVAQLAHDEGYKAVLTGEGADELFLGYPRLASQPLERLARAPIAALRKVYGRVPGLLDAVLDERDRRSNDFLRGIAGGFEGTVIERLARDRYDFVPEREARLQAASVVMASTSLQALLQRNDRMGMSASIESRFPFLDERVVAFALNLPVRWKLRRGRRLHDAKHPFVVDKAPVRAVLSDLLGPELAGRRKLGFPTRGLHGVRVDPVAFAGGWAFDTFGAQVGYVDDLRGWDQPYDLSKLMSLEIFGRLFDARQPLDEVERFVRSSVSPLP